MSVPPETLSWRQSLLSQIRTYKQAANHKTLNNIIIPVFVRKYNDDIVYGSIYTRQQRSDDCRIWWYLINKDRLDKLKYINDYL